MSAAEQADPTRTYAMNADSGAAVIPLSLNKHRRRAGAGGLRAVRGRRDAMTTTPDAGNTRREPATSTAAAAFAETIETTFLAAGHSLTEPATEAVFLTTLDIWQRALEGSHATGVIDAGQLAELSAVIDGMRQAPRLV